ALQGALERAIRTDLPRGIAHSGDLEASSASQLRILRGDRDQLVDRDSVPDQNDFHNMAARHVPWSAPAGLTELQRLALIRFFEPTIRLDVEATDSARARARAAVP